jgi:hypothetical protein
MAGPPSLDKAAEQKLLSWWDKITTGATSGVQAIPQDILEAISRSINSKTKTYRYVLPTQLACKAADPALDARSIQATCGLPGAFDARSVSQSAIVRFDRENHNVLGGSAEPYANNPVRIPAILPGERAAQKDKQGFDDLVNVLEYAQRNPSQADTLLAATLLAVHARLASTTVVYPVPHRASLVATLGACESFLNERTGGIRLQSVAVALMRTLGKRFGLYESVVAHHVNTSDASSGSAADLECADANGATVIAVEVKDRALTLHHAQDKLPALRSKRIREMIFLVQGGVIASDRESIDALIAKEFATGQNIYVSEFTDFLAVSLIQTGEAGRREFLEQVGHQLDESKADVSHRARWSALLSGI